MEGGEKRQRNYMADRQRKGGGREGRRVGRDNLADRQRERPGAIEPWHCCLCAMDDACEGLLTSSV